MSGTEYRAMDGLITVDGDELLFRRGGRLVRAVAGPADFRIPIDSLRAVLAKASRVSGGWICLITAHEEIPKPTLCSVADRRWTLQFRAGQAARMRELATMLQERIETNLARGVDPASVRQPYADPTGAAELDAMKQRALGSSLVVGRVGGSVGELVASARVRPEYADFWSDLQTLPHRLAADEAVRLILLAFVGPSAAIVGLTNRRVLIHRDSPMGRVSDELELPVTASWNSSLVTGALTLRTGWREIRLRGLSDADAQALMGALPRS